MCFTNGKKATPPCPCGYLGASHRSCRCSPDQIARYQGRLSGPLMDRIDLHVEVAAVTSAELLRAPAGESSADIRDRVAAARALAMARQHKCNNALQGQEIDHHIGLDAAATRFLDVAATRLGWSARGTHRVLKVARTIADLAGARHTQVAQLAEAMQYRPLVQAGC